MFIRISSFILGLLLSHSALALSASEQRMLDKGKPYFGLAIQAIEEVWPEMPQRSVLPAQVQKESLWNPRAELCVPKPSCSRERGMGFGQFTITARFNAFNEVKLLHPSLRDWHPKDHFDPRRQLIAMVAKDRLHFRQCKPLMETVRDSMACAMSSYNGGFGGFSSDRKLCSNTAGCNPKRWFGNVELTSFKAKKPLTGYGQSFYQINRGYVRTILLESSLKYVPFFGS